MQTVKWDVLDALRLFAEMSPLFHAHGYLLAVYGSILTSKEPKDFDLLAIPWRPNPLPPKTVFDDVCSAFKLSPDLGLPYLGLMRSWSHTARNCMGQVLDIQFRRSDVSLEESFEYSMRQSDPA